MAHSSGKYKLLTLDLDGSLLNSRSRISDTNIEWIRRAAEAGITVCISTGRGFPTTVPYAEQIGLDTPMVTINGGEIWTKQPGKPHVIHKRVLMDAAVIVRLHEIAVERGIWYWAYTTERMYNTEAWPSDPLARQWLKFGYHSEDRALLNEILEQLREMPGLELSNSGLDNIEVNAAGVSKGAALVELCRLVGCDISEAVHVGDSLNDITAIRAAGLGAAMGNAMEEVKQAANVITARNDEDGVAQVIRNYLLN